MTTLFLAFQMFERMNLCKMNHDLLTMGFLNKNHIHVCSVSPRLLTDRSDAPKNMNDTPRLPTPLGKILGGDQPFPCHFGTKASRTVLRSPFYEFYPT